MKIILLCVCVVLVCKLDGQDMPLIHANSGSVDVEEDGIFLKGIWNLSPAVRPDVYGIMRSNKTKRVTFFTDMDSISFMVSASSVYDFIILLNERDSCYTRIMIIDPLPVRSDAEMPETIAFELGEDNFIHLPVSVNGSQPLDFI
ncbi:MAG: hypothetical protein KDD94_10660, partial [Calditrichaeota bacterium]|nr:hypothetical protein [Calditrichota bacterium]